MTNKNFSELHAEFDALDLQTLRQRQGNKWRLYDADVVPAWVADMDLTPPRQVRDWIAKRALDGDLGYAPRANVDPMPHAFSAWSGRRYGWSPNPERMSIVTDIVQCLYLSVLAYSEPGDGIVVQTPLYPPMLASINDTDRKMRVNPLVRGPDGFEVDFDHLRQVVDSRTKILMLCSPHNPSGRVFSRQELETFGEIALEHDLIVLADEIHGDVLFDGRQHVPFASLSDELARRTVTFSSATKSFNLAGLRAALAMFGTAELQERFHFLPARVLGGLSALNSAAAAMAWNDCEDWFDGTVQYLQSNRDYLTQRLSQDFPGIVYHPAQATFLSWLDCEQLDLPEPPFELLLAKARVALSDGRPFGPGGEQCVRLNFATSRQVLTEILDRMQSALY